MDVLGHIRHRVRVIDPRQPPAQFVTFAVYGAKSSLRVARLEKSDVEVSLYVNAESQALRSLSIARRRNVT